MNDQRWEHIKAVFEQAIARPAAERDAFVDEAAAGDSSLRAEVASLLAAHAEAGKFLEPGSAAPPASPDASRAASEGLVGRRIGSFSLLRVLGHGGMGTVYEAEQETPRRRVALKVVRGDGHVDDRVGRLFRREIEALARLNHPHIAALYEAGHTEDGRHYFAMELVDGEPVTRFATGNGLPLNDRLLIFAQVCDALAYAHQRGVIHLDVKPTNVLVGRSDSRGRQATPRAPGDSRLGGSSGDHGAPEVRPKVLDFGLARITHSDSSLTTMTANVGRIEGTLAYMSPEQARGRPEEIDLRSDIYSLGVLLYELVTDKLPYEVRTLPLPHAVQRICEEPPARPSTINRTVRGDLETIVLKALEKEPGRRYQSAGELARDVRHYLAGEAIEAKRDSGWYMLRKSVRRYRVPLAVASLLFVVVSASAVVSLRSLRLARERLREVERANATAQREARIAQAVSDFLNDDVLAAADPSEAGREVTVREAIDLAARSVEERFGDAPEIESAVRRTIGATYASLGATEPAIGQLESALELARASFGAADARTVRVMGNLAWAYYNADEFGKSEAILREQCALMERSAGAAEAEFLRARAALGNALYAQQRREEALAVLEECLGRAEPLLAAPEEADLDGLQNLGVLCQATGRYDEAERVLTSVVSGSERIRGPEAPGTLAARTMLANALMSLNKEAEAEALLRETLAAKERILGAEHYSTLATMEYLARALKRQTKLEEAERVAEACLERRREALGPDHPHTRNSMWRLGEIQQQQGRYAEAEAMYRQVLEGEDAAAPTRLGLEVMSVLGEMLLWQNRPAEAEPLLLGALEGLTLADGAEAVNTLTVKQNLAWLRNMQGDPAAEALYREVLETRLRVLGPDHLHTGTSKNVLGEYLMNHGRVDEAEPLFREAYETWRKIAGEDHPNTTWAYQNIGWALQTRGRFDEAEPYYADALERRRRVLGPAHDHTLRSAQQLAYVWWKLERYDDAATLYREAIEQMRGRFGERHAVVAGAIHRLAQILRDAKEYDAAEVSAREALDMLREVAPNDHTGISGALGLLGTVLSDGLGRYAEAEEVLHECLELRRANLAEGHWQIALTRSALGGAIAAQGRFEEAEPLLVEGYERMAVDPQADRKQVRQALERVEQLYLDWEKPEQAAEYHARLAAFDQTATAAAR